MYFSELKKKLTCFYSCPISKSQEFLEGWQSSPVHPSFTSSFEYKVIGETKLATKKSCLSTNLSTISLKQGDKYYKTSRREELRTNQRLRQMTAMAFIKIKYKN